jgi:hypothetical protein
MIKAVITADIMQSTEMTDSARVLIYTAVKDVLNSTTKGYNMQSEMYRGDSFQCLINNPKDGLRVALLIKTFIKSVLIKETLDTRKQTFDVRMALGIGGISLKTNNVITSDGEAFQLSGRLLDELKRTKATFSIVTNDDFNNELSIESLLLDTIITDLSPMQSEVIYYKLLNYNETEIAKKLNVNQSAINQRSVSGNWNVINKMVQHFEKMYSNG